jgi:peptide-methionine (S)-S-oxide reductase
MGANVRILSKLEYSAAYVKGGLWIAGALGCAVLVAVALNPAEAQRTKARGASSSVQAKPTGDEAEKLDKATFGGGCFWCTEAFFQELKGVESVVSGYSGGFVENPTYKAVCTGRTGHAEVIQLTYHPSEITYTELLEVFWKTHDPTTLNRQGPDIGPQYRSVIFHHDDEQKKLATYYKAKLNENRAFGAPVVTEISPFTKFYPAEKYHQDFFQLNPRQQYCARIIAPKMKKFRRVFEEKLKTNSDE